MRKCEPVHSTALQAIPATLYLPQFELDFPVMRVAGMGDYFPVRAFCKRIGLAPQPQLERLQADHSYASGVETFTVPTAGGPQDALCIRKKELNQMPLQQWPVSSSGLFHRCTIALLSGVQVPYV